MPAEQPSLPSVTVAGVSAIILSLLLAFGALITGLVIFIMPQLPNASTMPPIPDVARIIMVVVALFFFALAVFGVFVGVAVIRRRNWARIMMMVWGGIMTPICLLLVVSMLLVFNMKPDDLPPGAGVSNPAALTGFMKFSAAVFYGIPAALGIWWLVLFTRKRVAAAFTHPTQAAVPVMDASGFPQAPAAIPASTSSQTTRPACPLPLTILGSFFIFCSAFSLVALAMPNPYAMPAFWFGHTFSSGASRLLLALMVIALGASSVAMLKLKSWGLHTLLVLQALYLVNGTVMALSPGYISQMLDTMDKASRQYSTLPGGNPFLTEHFVRTFLGIGLLVSLFFAALLVFYRSRFLEQAAAKAQAS